jgi:hypothetical protein
MAIITKELALKIAQKLKAKVVKRDNKAHDIAFIYYKDKIVAHFGIRRGSSKNLGHDHVPEQIFLRPSEAKLLGQCPLSREDWLETISKKGKI